MEGKTGEIKTLAKEIVAQLAKLSRHDTATIRNLRRQFSKRLEHAKPEFVVTLALEPIRLPVVPRFVVYELIQYHPPAMASLNVKTLEELAEGNQSWETVDAFACYLAGPAWREGQISDAVVKRWARSRDRWWRRTAVVSTVPLNNKARGGNGDTSRTLMICEMCLDDSDDMVVKAMSWALRALAIRDAEAVRNFIVKHQDSLAKRITREVNNKLQTGLKNPRR